MSGERDGLGRNAFHDIAIRNQDESPVVDHRMVRPVVLVRQTALGDGHAHSIGYTLAQRARGCLDAGGDERLGVPGCFTAQLTKSFEIVQRQRIARQVHQRIQQHAAMAR